MTSEQRSQDVGGNFSTDDVLSDFFSTETRKGLAGGNVGVNETLKAQRKDKERGQWRRFFGEKADMPMRKKR